MTYTPATFCSSLMSTVAQRERECQGGPVDILESLPGTSTFCSDMADAIASGRMQFVSGAAASCPSAISAATCASLAGSGQTLPTACMPVLQGAVAAGGNCYSSLDCANNGVCSIPSTFPTPTCGGTCIATVAVGQPCMPTDVCTAGGSCTGSPPVCAPAMMTSQTFVQKGGSCASDPTSSVWRLLGLPEPHVWPFRIGDVRSTGSVCPQLQ